MDPLDTFEVTVATELLKTKFYVPVPPEPLVARRRLAERLNLGLTKKLILLAAPAGFGKTTVLAKWAALLKIPLAWLSLDSGDNDMARFLAYFASALTSLPEMEPDAEQPDAGQQAPDEILSTLINRVSGIQTDFVIVLDDYHLVDLSTINAAIAFLLEHQPPQMHLVIATRADPDLPLARLRASGQLVEIREGDLRFTPAEAEAFLSRVNRLALQEADVSVLLDRTEGWPAGLQLAALALQSREDASEFIAAFAGSHEYIADYLQMEVLSRQPTALQAFLLQSSILDQLSGSLCEAVTGQDGGQQTLEQLRNMNLFLSSLDDERRWFRYHGLFADLLRQTLQRTRPDEIPGLHRRASRWYAAHERPAEAIKHALAAGDAEQAAELIASVAEETLMYSEVRTFANWIEALPRETTLAYPLLSVYYAWALLLLGTPLSTVESWLQSGDAGPGRLSDSALPLYAYVALLQGRTSRAAELAQQALSRLPEDESYLRSLALWLLGLSTLGDADPATSLSVLEGTAQTSRAVGNVMVLVLTLCNQAELLMIQGRPFDAQTRYQRALALAKDAQGNKLPVAGAALTGLGELAREWNNLQTAEHYLVEGIELTKQWAWPAALDGYFSLALVRVALRQESAAVALIEEARQIAERFDATEEDDWLVAYVQARLWLQIGKLEAVWDWVRDRGVDQEIMTDQPAGDETRLERKRKYERLILARLLLKEGRPAEALALLKSTRPLLERRGRVRTVIEVLNLMALAHQAQGDLEQALNSLGEALRMAEPGGHVRIFLDLGPPMAQLLYQAIEQQILPAYAGKLLAHFPENIDRAAGQEAERLIQPLSPREQEVLALIAQGLSNHEIAGTLVLSPSTVKVHTRNIYRKLEVGSRTQAIARAKLIGLL